MKKAYELSVLCGCEIGLVVFTPTQKLFLYSSQPMDELLLKYTELTERQEPAEALDNDEMVRLIERSQEGLMPGMDAFDDGDMDDDDEYAGETEVTPVGRLLSVC